MLIKPRCRFSSATVELDVRISGEESDICFFSKLIGRFFGFSLVDYCHMMQKFLIPPPEY